VAGVIAVVVPNWNGAARLPACIRSLAAQTAGDVEIVVVDNGSVDESLAVLEELAAEVAPVVLTVVRNATNLGFAGGVNAGIAAALDRGARAVALFNNDAVADPGWLAALVAELDARPDVAIVTSRFLLGDGRTVDSTGDFYTSWGVPYPRDRDAPSEPVRPSGEVFGGSGGASLYRAGLFADIGLFDERFFVLFEDVDLSFRARLAGHRAWYCADAVAYHDQGATQRTVSGMAARQYVRNLPLLLVKDVPARLIWRVAPRFAIVYPMLIVNLVRRRQGRAALGGAAAGLALLPGALRSRRAIQRDRRLRGRDLDDLLWPGLPPNLQAPRAVGAWLRRLTGRPAAEAAGG
jgi:GT2 family glycosyltransferase